jgi:hypothetical protein
MTYKVSVDEPEPPKIDNDVRKGLWKSYQQGLFDGVTIQVEGRQFKVVLIIKKVILITFYRFRK